MKNTWWKKYLHFHSNSPCIWNIRRLCEAETTEVIETYRHEAREIYTPFTSHVEISFCLGVRFFVEFQFNFDRNGFSGEMCSKKLMKQTVSLIYRDRRYSFRCFFLLSKSWHNMLRLFRYFWVVRKKFKGWINFVESLHTYMNNCYI